MLEKVLIQESKNCERLVKGSLLQITYMNNFKNLQATDHEQ